MVAGRGEEWEVRDFVESLRWCMIGTSLIPRTERNRRRDGTSVRLHEEGIPLSLSLSSTKMEGQRVENYRMALWHESQRQRRVIA